MTESYYKTESYSKRAGNKETSYIDGFIKTGLENFLRPDLIGSTLLKAFKRLNDHTK